MLEQPPEGTTNIADWVWRQSNTKKHSSMSFTAEFIGITGSLGLFFITSGVGLFLSSKIFRGGIATIDFLNMLFVLMLTGILTGLGVRDDQHYRIGFSRRRFRRYRLIDVLAPYVYTVVTALWGELILRPILAARAIDPAYRQHPNARSVEALQIGADTVIAVYYLIFTAVLVLYFLSLKFNPVDLDAYDRLLLRSIRFGRATN